MSFRKRVSYLWPGVDDPRQQTHLAENPQRLRSDLSDRTKAWPMRLPDSKGRVARPKGKNKAWRFSLIFILLNLRCFFRVKMYLIPFCVLTGGGGLRLRCIYTSSPRDPPKTDLPETPPPPKVGFTAGLEACGQRHWTQAASPRKPPGKLEILVKLYSDKSQTKKHPPGPFQQIIASNKHAFFFGWGTCVWMHGGHSSRGGEW